jgi:membrane associated rhomboid family serine protease
MGIYDREYYGRDRQGRPTGAAGGLGLGGFRLRSVTGWLIIINTLIFVVNMVLAPYGAPVVVQTEPANLRLDQVVTDGIVRDALGHPIPRVVPALVRDTRTNRLVPDPGGRTLPNPNLQAGNVGFLLLFDGQTGDRVGTATVVMMTPLNRLGHFSTVLGFLGLEVWRLVTFQFLHASFSHLFFNMLGLYLFGGFVEQHLGSKRYAAFYLVCGVLGAVAYLALNLLGYILHAEIPGLLRNSIFTPLIGASAGVFGVIVASAYLAPNMSISFMLLPISFKLKYLAYGYVALATFNLLRGAENAGGEAAHLGGAIAGWFFIRNAHLLRDFFDVFSDSRKKDRGPPRPPGRGILGRGAPAAPNQAEVDRILAKVTAQGIQSLTVEEKRILREATEQQRRS